MAAIEIIFVWIAWSTFPNEYERWFRLCPYLITVWSIEVRVRYHWIPYFEGYSLEQVLGGRVHESQKEK